MNDRTRGLRRHITYANVMATLTAFVVLAGGTAFAATQLAKKSVGAKQLKANAVTAAKIKKQAVTTAKIRAGAVDGSKVKPGGLNAVDFQLDTAPYTRIASEIRINTNIAVPTGGEPKITPLPGASYTQEAGRTDIYVGALDVEFSSTCTDRAAAAYLLMDVPPSEKFGLATLIHAVAVGTFEEKGGGQAMRRINLGSFVLGTRPAPGSAQSHSFSALIVGSCKTGSGITAKSFSIDVIGTKNQ